MTRETARQLADRLNTDLGLSENDEHFTPYHMQAEAYILCFGKRPCVELRDQSERYQEMLAVAARIAGVSPVAEENST